MKLSVVGRGAPSESHSSRVKSSFSSSAADSAGLVNCLPFGGVAPVFWRYFRPDAALLLGSSQSGVTESSAMSGDECLALKFR